MNPAQINTPAPPGLLDAPLSALDDANEIMTRFERYGFRDAQGHPLTTCQDFIDLVIKAAADPAKA